MLQQPIPAAVPFAPDSPELEETFVSTTAARLEANRANALLSTGPRSTEGKAASSRNAVKTALTGRTVLLPGDDAERYERHLAHYDKLYRPVGDQEIALVQSLADTMWRLDRIPGLEEALYVKGCNEFTAQVCELDPREQLTMLRMHTYLAYERQFRNLNIQEMRLFRHREKLIAEIVKLQQERAQKEKDDFAAAAQLYIKARTERKPFDPAEYGFEFSTSDVEAYLEGARAAQLTRSELANAA
ncbi:MAG TPA: hypothetical protein VH351_09040 [Bryobacteraceae bacterium]|nr:hypothetical protein [Bryobacteraceae bacterium]